MNPLILQCPDPATRDLVEQIAVKLGCSVAYSDPTAPVPVVSALGLARRLAPGLTWVSEVDSLGAEAPIGEGAIRVRMETRGRSRQPYLRVRVRLVGYTWMDDWPLVVDESFPSYPADRLRYRLGIYLARGDDPRPYMQRRLESARALLQGLAT